MILLRAAGVIVRKRKEGHEKDALNQQPPQLDDKVSSLSPHFARRFGRLVGTCSFH